MSQAGTPTCRVIHPGESTYRGKQGFDFAQGISARPAGAKALCMILLTIPPGARASAHRHENHETAVYLLSGAVPAQAAIARADPSERESVLLMPEREGLVPG